MNILIGHSGFVGSNLAGQYSFDGLFDETNVTDSFGSCPDTCFYAGVPAQKFLANRAPAQDRQTIETAIQNIQRIAPRRLMLISTIDVFQIPAGPDETAAVNINGLHPYGLHRYQLEEWVRENIADHCVVRLPALFGKNLKKNFLYDLIHFTPTMLSAEKFAALRALDPFLEPYYALADNGMYTVAALSGDEKQALRGYFEYVGFSAMNFTDSRATFPFYNLAYLRRHIDAALAREIKLLHCAVESLTAAEIVRAVRGREFVNELPGSVAHYDFASIHAEALGGQGTYLFNKEQVMADIIAFVEGSE